jgi:CHAT domain-containing protein
MQFPAERRTVLGAPGNPQGWPPAQVPEVLEKLRNLQGVVHLACHGIWDLLDPWQGSGLFLADALDAPNLTLDSLSSLGVLDCDLAILSACETALTNPGDLTEDYIGLPASFLLAGARTVYGSLWEIDDVATALLVIRSCLELTSYEGGQPDFALRLWKAQKWLRTASLEELWQSIEALPCEEALKWKTRALLHARTPSHRPLSHPHWWAALVCIGRP